MHTVVVSDNISANPSGYDAAHSVYQSVNASYPIANGYANSASTTYAQINIKTGSQAESFFYYTFAGLDAIPADARIVSVACAAKAYISTTSSGYIATRQMQMAAGTTVKGSAVTITNTATVYNLTTGDWTRAELLTAAVRLYAKRGTSSTSTTRYWRFYGATLTVTYEYNEVYYTITASSVAPDASVAPATQDIRSGQSGVVTITAESLTNLDLFDNGVEMSNSISPTGSGGTYTISSINTDHDLVLAASQLELIFDRQQSDVARVQTLRQKIKAGTATADELSEYLTAPIGSYCAVDLNRVGVALNEVAALLTVEGYPLTLNAKTDWTNADEFLDSDLTAYLSLVEQLRSALAVYPTTPETPDDVATWQQANDVERIIEDVFELQKAMRQAYFYLGDLYLGEV